MKLIVRCQDERIIENLIGVENLCLQVKPDKSYFSFIMNSSLDKLKATDDRDEYNPCTVHLC